MSTTYVITKSLISNIFLLVHRLISLVHNSGIFHTTLELVRIESEFKSSINMEITCGLSGCPTYLDYDFLVTGEEGDYSEDSR